MTRISLYILLCVCACAKVCAQSAYINKVYEYRPAPGQFINTLPAYEEGDDEEDMIAKAATQIVGKLGSTNYICLGAWGGFVTVGFDHTIANLPGEVDFAIGGNAVKPGKIVNNQSRRESGTFAQDSLMTGSAEPGIIYVSRDDNHDGLPNDTWYEIAGSEYAYTRDYSVTYYRPSTATADILARDCDGHTFYVKRNTYHQQPYYPEWEMADSIVCSGRLLPNNILPGTITLVTLQYGYADNHQNSDERSRINIDWAVTADGQPAHLQGIDFVRIQTGVSQDGYVMGETSTEVTGVMDLHPTLRPESAIDAAEIRVAAKYFKNGRLVVERDGKRYDILGNEQ